MNALGSLGDASREEHLHFCLLIRTICEESQKVYSRSGDAQRQSLRQPIHFNIKPGYFQILNASSVQ